jgi:hypothetical protein
MLNSFEDIVKVLLSHENKFSASVEIFSGAPSEKSFKDVFGIENEELNKYGSILVDWMSIESETRKYFSKLHWLIRAIMQFQDLLSLTLIEIPKDTNELSEIFCRHHCYYEALVYLRSGVLSLININSIASITMLRPIVEQFIYSVYWDIIQDDGNINKYNSWLRTKKGKPTFKDAMAKIESDLSQKRNKIVNRISKVCMGIKDGYHVLCTWTHTPTVDDSFTTGGFGPIQGDLGDWMFCIHMYNMALINILHLYIYQYPMSLFPVDLIHKWGCNMPVGVFVDEWSAAIIEKALGDSSIKKLRDVFADDQEVIAKLDHANKFTILSDDEIWKTWDNSQNKPVGAEKPNDIQMLSAQQKAQIRSMGWAFNYMPKMKIEEKLTSSEENFFKILYS